MRSTRGLFDLETFQTGAPYNKVYSVVITVVRHYYSVSSRTRKRVVYSSVVVFDVGPRSETTLYVSFTVTTPRRLGTPHVTGSMANRIIKYITYCACTDKRTSFVGTHNIILHVLTYNRNRPNRLCESVCARSM